jgi:hypothetical protein
MMETVSTSEASVNFYQTTRRNIPEDSHLHNPVRSAGGHERVLERKKRKHVTIKKSHQIALRVRHQEQWELSKHLAPASRRRELD